MKINNSINKKETLKRIKLLEQYFKSSDFKIQDNEFEDKKHRTYKLRIVQPHVGTYYDCVRDKKGNRVRIVIMGLEALDEKCYDVKKRTEQIQIKTANLKRNPHMQGTTRLLEYILKDLCGMDIENEYIDGEHIFKYFSLSNWHIGSYFLKGTKKPYRMLIKPEVAAEHFVKTMKILEPTIVILQGKSIYFGSAFNKYNKQSEHKYCWKYFSETCKEYTVFKPSCNNVFDFPVIRFLHPSQRGKNRWTVENGYFDNTIVPILKKYYKS